MTKANITIAVLAILIVVLCVLCYAGKPLITGQEDAPEIKALAKNIGETRIGQKIFTHYLYQLVYFCQLKVGPYDGIPLEDKDKTGILMLTNLFAGLVALAGFFAGIILFVINSGQQSSVSKPKLALMVAMVIFAGTAIRMILAAMMYGNFDMQSYEIVTGIVDKGGNVYAETSKYNYSPVWFMVLLALKRIQLTMPGLPFHIIVKSFLCCVDLLTLGVLLFIANIRKLPPVRTAIFFYLSPVSFLVTGYHGQFENFAMLMVLIGIFMYLRFSARPVLRVVPLWLFATAGMIVKHNVFYELIICLHSSVKRYWVKIPLFVVSVVIFFSLFIPYWDVGKKGIIDNVFGYGSGVGVYGVTSLFVLPQLKYVFIPAMFIFPLFLKSRDIIAQCLLGTLFFLTFTTGVSIQYLVLPVALGALRPSKFLLFYTLVASFFVLGNLNNVFIPGFNLFEWNIVWIGAICWFVAEMRLDRQANGVAAERLDYYEMDEKK
jgi:hypothetical protein